MLIDAQDHEHAAPVDDVGDDARGRGAQQIAGNGGGEQPPDHDLPLRQRHEVGDQRHADREAAAAGGAGQHAQHEQQRKARHHRRQEATTPPAATGRRASPAPCRRRRPPARAPAGRSRRRRSPPPAGPRWWARSRSLPRSAAPPGRRRAPLSAEAKIRKQTMLMRAVHCGALDNSGTPLQWPIAQPTYPAACSVGIGRTAQQLRADEADAEHHQRADKIVGSGPPWAKPKP